MKTSNFRFVILCINLIGQLIYVNAQDSSHIVFPEPFAVAIDDMGWNNGSDLGENGGQGPYRAGVNKHFDMKDYQAIVKAGQQVGVRFQGLFVLCEMDRKNVCAQYPTITMYGNDWDNTKNISDEQIEIMNYVKGSAAFLEFGLHGVGHEFWPEKMHKVRAEWYNIIEHKPWPEEILRNHLKCFKEIMAQYDLTPENGQSFPESFVPCAYSYYWNPKGSYSLGKLLNENGVRYANTLFTYVNELNPPSEPNGGDFDHGVLVINRINYGNPWYQLGATPTTDLNDQKSNMIESHFPNWLAQDSFLQDNITEKWVSYLKTVQYSSNRYLAKNTEQFYSQWLYKKYTKVKELKEGEVVLDNTFMDNNAYTYNLLGNLVMKVKVDSLHHISSASLNNMPISCYFEDAGYAFIYLPKLEKKVYSLKYTIGSDCMSNYIYNNGTYNVYNYLAENNSIKFELKMYGTQLVKMKSKKPVNVLSSNPNLKVISFNYDQVTGFVFIKVAGRNIQGEKGTISVLF